MTFDPIKAAMEAQKMAEEMQKKIQEQLKNGNVDPSKLASEYMAAMSGMIPNAEAMKQMASINPGASMAEAFTDDFEDEENIDYNNPDNLTALCEYIEKSMKEVAALPADPKASVAANDPKWLQMGIMCSGILSKLNGHSLDSLYIEEPNDEDYTQEIKEGLEESWSVENREELLDMLEYLSEEGHRARYAAYCKAKNAEALFDDDMDEEEKAGVTRGFLFADRFKKSKKENDLLGWDLGRYALLVRFGFYVGWFSEEEASSMLISVAKRLSEVYGSWKEFGNSYKFGGAFWKVMGDPSSAKENDSNIAEAITELLTKDMFGTVGEWSTSAWLTAK